MVLKYLAFTILAILCFQSDDESLLNLYERKIKKELSVDHQDKQLKLNESFNRPFAYWEEYRIENEDNVQIIVASIFTCNLGGCTAEQAYQKSKTSQEYFDILLEIDDNKITRLKMLQYFSDYGYELSSKKYLNKYIGKEACDFVNSDMTVDGISGATISVDALQGFLSALCD